MFEMLINCVPFSLASILSGLKNKFLASQLHIGTFCRLPSETSTIDFCRTTLSKNQVLHSELLRHVSFHMTPFNNCFLRLCWSLSVWLALDC